MATTTKYEAFKIAEYKQLIHLSLEKEHAAINQSTFICPDYPQLHGKAFCVETHTPRKGFMKYGKPQTMVYLHEENSPIFKTHELLIDHYCFNSK